MTRALFGIAFAFVLCTLIPAQAQFSSHQPTRLDVTSEQCDSKRNRLVYTGNDFTGVVIYKFTMVKPADSLIVIYPCIGNDTMFTVVNGSDPSTFVRYLPTQCAQFWGARYPNSTGCEEVTIEVEAMTPTSYCETEWTKNNSYPKFGFCEYSPSPEPTPSASTAAVLSMTAAATLAVFVTSLAAL